MRPSALFPLLCAAAACVLSVLCLVAGYRRNFMEDYHMLTLNTSRIGYNVLNPSNPGGDSSNPLSSLLHNISSSVGNDISGQVNQIAGSIADRIGIHDFYSWHVMDYCYGSYVPTPLPNATIPRSRIHKNVLSCSNDTAMFSFNPTAILQQELNETGLNITLADLHWPDEIRTGLEGLRAAAKAVFVLYCISIGLTFLAVIFALLAFLASGRLAAFVNILISILAFLALGIASGIVTAIQVKGTNTINDYGHDIGIEAHHGDKFAIITWIATGLILVAMLLWTMECIIGHRRRRNVGYAEK